MLPDRAPSKSYRSGLDLDAASTLDDALPQGVAHGETLDDDRVLMGLVSALPPDAVAQVGHPVVLQHRNQVEESRCTCHLREQPCSASEQNRNQVDPHFVEQAGSQALAGYLATVGPHELAVGQFDGLVYGVFDASADEVELLVRPVGRQTVHQHHNWAAERMLPTPALREVEELPAHNDCAVSSIILR
jgi:hypothetical protein